MKKTKKLLKHNKNFQWLNTFEASVLARGGNFDSEGALHNEHGCVRCTSMIKSIGTRCKNFAIEGELYCRIHGGTLIRAKRGLARTYSAFIQNSTLRTVYENNINNDEIAGVKEELSLLRVLLASTLNKHVIGDVDSIKSIASIISEIRALVKDCTNTEIKLGQLIDIGKVTIIVKSLANIISKYIKDKETLEQIAIEFDNVIWPTAVASTPQPARETPSREIPMLPE